MLARFVILGAEILFYITCKLTSLELSPILFIFFIFVETIAGLLDEPEHVTWKCSPYGTLVKIMYV